jgi:hypothetical protein
MKKIAIGLIRGITSKVIAKIVARNRFPDNVKGIQIAKVIKNMSIVSVNKYVLSMNTPGSKSGIKALITAILLVEN